MKRPPHIPQRTCMGCGRRSAQGLLLRVGLEASGQLALRQPQAHGRSGYLHSDAACWQAFAARKGPLRSLGRVVDRAERVAFLARVTESGVTSSVR